NGDLSFMLRLARKAASLLNVSKAPSSIPKSVKKVVSVDESLPHQKSSIRKCKKSSITQAKTNFLCFPNSLMYIFSKTVAHQFLRCLIYSLLQDHLGVLATLRAYDPCYAALSDHQDCDVGVLVL